MKKFLALVLALTMLMGMSVNVFAEGPTVEKCTGADHPTQQFYERSFDGYHYIYCSWNHAEDPIVVRAYKDCHDENEGPYVLETLYDGEGCAYICKKSVGEGKYCNVQKDYKYHAGEPCDRCGWGMSCGPVSCAPVKVEKYEEPATPAAEIRAAEEEALVVNVVTKDKTQVAKDNESVIPGAAYNMSAFVTTKGFVAGLNKVIKANAKETTVSIYTKNPFAFSKSLVKAINDGKKDVVYYFTHAGHVYSVTIPAGTDASTILEKNGFAGPLYVGKVLGTTTLVK